MPRGRVGTDDGEDIKEGFLVGEPNGMSHGQKDRRNRHMFL